MAISRVSNSSVLSNTPKKRSMLASNDPIYAGSYESIATVTVGSGGSATVDFTSIPTTYTHLQLRVTARSMSNTSVGDGLLMRVGTGGTLDTTSTVWAHYISGDGATITNSFRSSTNMELLEVSSLTSTTSVFGVGVIDFLDYASTSKTKTFRSLTGFDQNGSGNLRITDGTYGASTAAINTIRFYSAFANIAQYSSFALYGIK